MEPRAKLMTVALLSGLLFLGVATGCASHETKTVKTVTVYAPAPAGSAAAEEPPHSAEQTETTTTTESNDRSPGIIGSAFRLVWAVVSFPFRVIGALF